MRRKPPIVRPWPDRRFAGGVFAAACAGCDQPEAAGVSSGPNAVNGGYAVGGAAAMCGGPTGGGATVTAGGGAYWTVGGAHGIAGGAHALAGGAGGVAAAGCVAAAPSDAGVDGAGWLKRCQASADDSSDRSPEKVDSFMRLPVSAVVGCGLVMPTICRSAEKRLTTRSSAG